MDVSLDYFGNSRDSENPTSGPFETVKDGPQELKVWPKNERNLPCLSPSRNSEKM